MKKEIRILLLFFLVSNFTAFSQLEGAVNFQSENTINSPAATGSGNPEIDRVISIVNTVDQKNNFVGQISADSTATLPFGVIKQIGAARYIIAVDSIDFKPQGAYFSAYAAIDFQGTTKKMACHYSRTTIYGSALQEEVFCQTVNLQNFYKSLQLHTLKL